MWQLGEKMRKNCHLTQLFGPTTEELFELFYPTNIKQAKTHKVVNL